MPKPNLPPVLVRSFALALPLVFGCQSAPGPAAAGNEAEPAAKLTGPEVAKISKIRGNRGVTSPDLPDGAFLGEGASIQADQWLELPRGTRVELELASGGRLRIDEDSRLRIPTASPSPSSSVSPAPTVVELTRGRLVVLAETHPIEILAADDRLVVERGEAELHHAGETRHYGVVQGHAQLHTAGRDIPLGPGASISTPASPATRPETPPDETLLAAALIPTLSLAPLQEAAWTAAFDETARLAEDVPQGVGSLVARAAGSKVERQSLRLTEQTVNVTISGRIARTEIEQTFHNDSGQTLEGIYQFPLPSDASISDLQLLVGDTWMRGEMLEKQRAREIFRQIVDATVPRDPALLQWEQGGVFKLNIFPIPGKGERRIKIAYTQVLPAVGQSLRYRYPMGGSGATATEIGDFQFNVTVDDAGLDAGSLAEVSTPMAELQRREGQGELQLSMRERDYQPTHELGVDVPLPREQSRVIAATHRDRDGQGYFMLTLRPELSLVAERKPVHYAFVLDRSHGTTADLWTAAEGMTKAMLATLEPDDRFTILACDTACDRLDGGLRAASETNTVGDVDRFLDRQVLAGASDIGNMLERAGESLDGLGSAATSGEVERVVVYMGDGAPTSGALTPDELGDLALGELAQLRIQAVALGARSDLLVLDNLVRQSGGDLLRVDARDDLDNVARELRLRAQVPVARDLALELPSGLTDVYPKAIPALRPGDTLTLVGKLSDGDASMLRGDVRLHGRNSAGAFEDRFQIMLDAEYSKSGQGAVHAHLPRTWAAQEITHLTQTEGAQASERIVALSREYNVLSRFTALLVLENDRMYREFNVARQAGNKDTWTGAPSEAPAEPEPELAPDPEAAPSTTPTDGNEQAALDNASQPAPVTPEPSPGGSPKDKSDFEPFAPEPDQSRDQRARGEEAAEREESFDDDFDSFPEGDAIGGGGNNGSGAGGTKGNSGFAPPPPEKAKKSEKRETPKETPKKKPSQGDDMLDWDGGGSWGGGSGRGWQEDWAPPQMLVRDASGPSNGDRTKIAELQRIRDVDPSNRKAHSNLVRRAIRDGHPDALAFAKDWALSDPDHAPALQAHADLLAAAGDPVALRAYASAIEVEPFSTKMHERMAEAHTLAGDFERACSHRRALVSIDPTNGTDAAAYAECLASSGRVTEARAALAKARETVTSSAGSKALVKAEKAVELGVPVPSSALHGNADLRAELRWTTDENLDLAFVDRRGKRLSVLRPEGVRVREERDGAQHVETMTLRQVDGTVFVEVTRPESNNEELVRATLTVKAVGASQTWTLLLERAGTQRIALARWE
jgi:hypothetical protein